ncbi:MAG TPA: UPF0182 family protein [Gemmatimonadales bacterium]|nr:UPF0182 family protein [Gemmatimonadales bacterium]
MTRSGWRSLYLIGAGLLVVALVGGRWLAVETAERAWDRTFAGGAVLIEARMLARLLQALVLVFATVWTTGNLLIVYRAIGSVQMPRRLGDLEIVEAVPRRVLFGITLALGIVLGVLLSLGTGDWWRHAVLAAAPPHFGVLDETLGLDAGYYLGVLPWQAALQNRALVLAAGVAGAVAVLYSAIGSLRIQRGQVRSSDYARAHCGVLLACLALVIAWGAALDPAEVVAGLHGAVDQAALSVRVPGAVFVAAMAVVTAIISLAWAWRDRPNLILAGWAALVLALAACYVVIPGVVRASGSGENVALVRQRAGLERVAFGLTALEERAPPAFPSGEAAIHSVPLWDPRRVGIVAGAPASAVALHAQRGRDGAPTWLIAPTAASAQTRVAVETDTGLALNPVPVTDSALVFGPGIPGFVVASPDSSPALRAAGVPIVGAWRRFALAWTIQAWGFLRADSNGRILLWRRDVAERLERLAPFARFGVPAPTIRDGALWWVSWGYVASAAFPLARPLDWRDGTIRYLRAGLVGAVRVATGETHLWLAPGYDSLTAAWARHFEPLIEPADRLPPDLRAQLTYPEEAFRITVEQLVRASADSAGADSAWTLRPRTPFQLIAPTPPGTQVWTGVGLESGTLAARQFLGLCAGTITGQGPRLYLWRPHQPTRLPGELVGSFLARPGQPRIWPTAGSVLTIQAQFLEPAGVDPPPPPRIAEVYVSLDGRSGRGQTARAALRGGEAAVTDTSLAARWQRARRLAAQADSALSAGDLELFGRLFRALVRELAPAIRPR